MEQVTQWGQINLTKEKEKENKKGNKMLYKLAADKMQLQQDAKNRMNASAKDFFGTKNFGKSVGHSSVGSYLGAAGVNGAIAKDTGVSTFGTTVKQGTKTYGAIGTGVGALTGLGLGLAHGGSPKRALIGALTGAITGGGMGVVGGALGSAAQYRLGYKFGQKPQNQLH